MKEIYLNRNLWKQRWTHNLQFHFQCYIADLFSELRYPEQIDEWLLILYLGKEDNIRIMMAKNAWTSVFSAAIIEVMFGSAKDRDAFSCRVQRATELRDSSSVALSIESSQRRCLSCDEVFGIRIAKDPDRPRKRY